MKKLITTTAILIALTALPSLANAGSGIRVEVPCGNKCPASLQPQPLFPNGSKAALYPNGLPTNVIIDGNPVRDTETPTYESVSRTVTPYGTVNSRYRSYDRTTGAR